MGTFQVSLRPIEMRDTQKIVEWRNASAVNQYFIDRSLLTAATHRKWLETRVFTGQVAQFIIQVDEYSVGSVYLRDIDLMNRKAEYGIFIGEKDAQNRGVGTKAGLLCLQYGFEILGLNRIFLRVFADNHRAIRSYEKMGFRQEGLFRQDIYRDIQFYDMLYMAILYQDWKEKIRSHL